MISKLFIAGVVTVALAGCTTPPPGYQNYLTTQEKIAADNKSAANVQAVALQKIATTSTDPTVQAVAAMMLGMAAGRQTAQVVAPPQNPALEWFRASTPLLGTLISGAFSLELQKDNNATQVEMYSTQMNTIGTIATQGLSTAQTLGTTGMDYASKPPVVIHSPAAAPAAVEAAPAQ